MLIEDKVNQLINVDFNTFKGVRAFYENSVFRKNLDKLGFSKEKLNLSEFNESIIPDSLFALMELH